MTLYAETSAVLAWLLGEARAREVRNYLAAAELVIASDLTLIECDRVLKTTAWRGMEPEAPYLRLLDSPDVRFQAIRPQFRRI